MKRVFADTSWFIALIAPTDAMHDHAKRCAAMPMVLVTTGWVMSEVAAYLAQVPNRSLFISLLKTVRESPFIEFMPVSASQFDDGAKLYADRQDKAWSLVDCISFVVMREHNLSEALTGDHHFEQAGFKALLLED